jgi:sodium transport system permease protein
MSRERPIDLPVAGAERAPSLVAALEEAGVNILPAPPDPEQAVKTGKSGMVLVVPEEYVEDFEAGRPAQLRLVVDRSNDRATPLVRRLNGIIERHGQQVGALRLVMRGVSPDLVRPIVLAEVDVASARKEAARLLGMIPMYVILIAFMGGMMVAIDATAGERERGSLEPLLVNPVPRTAIVAGKWLAATTFAAVAVLIMLGNLLFVLPRMKLEELGVVLDLGAAEVAGMLAAVLPLAVLAAGLEVLVATFARSYKEAQTQLSYIMLLPMVPGIVSILHPIPTKAWMHAVPVIGQQALLSDVIAGEAVPLSAFMIAGASSLIVGLACAWATSRLFQRERIIYGR